MRQLTLFLIFCFIGICASPQSTGRVNVSATIVTPDNICSLSLNSPDGNIFTLANGQDNCFDITLSPIDPLNMAENNYQTGTPELQYSLSKPELLSANDLRITITQPEPSANPSPSNHYTLSIHYN